MWKFVTRGIRETLERRACRTNVYSQTSQDNTKDEVKTNLTCNLKFLSPYFSVCNKEFCGSSRTSGFKNNNEDSKWNTKYTMRSEVSGWYGVLAFGLVVCQTLCLRRRLFEKETSDSFKNKLSKHPKTRTPCIFGQVLNIRPRHILPVTNCAGNSNVTHVQQEKETEWKADRPYGPITIEEALEEATEIFANTHKLAIGEFELSYGLKALEEKRYKDAIKHFAAGAKLSSVASMFNLGLCYELGLGTLADQTKAAKYYIDAAEQGHADAMYNLGVFYAQGRGGFSVDIDKARNYFIKAAKMGQSQAQDALSLEKRYYQSLQEEDNTAYSEGSENIMMYSQKVQNVNHILKKLINYTHVFSTRSDDNKEHNQSETEVQNSTDLFLEMLGIKEPKILPVSVNINNYSVSC